MKQITKPMIILGVICIVCAGLLGIVESVTREPIRIQNEATANAGMQKVAPDAASFEAVELEEGENVDGIEVASVNKARRGDAIPSAPLPSRAVSNGVTAAIDWAVDYAGGAN